MNSAHRPCVGALVCLCVTSCDTLFARPLLERMLSSIAIYLKLPFYLTRGPVKYRNPLGLFPGRRFVCWILLLCSHLWGLLNIVCVFVLKSFQWSFCSVYAPPSSVFLYWKVFNDLCALFLLHNINEVVFLSYDRRDVRYHRTLSNKMWKIRLHYPVRVFLNKRYDYLQSHSFCIVDRPSWHVLSPLFRINEGVCCLA